MYMEAGGNWQREHCRRWVTPDSRANYFAIHQIRIAKSLKVERSSKEVYAYTALLAV
jgi:hypothetical protein